MDKNRLWVLGAILVMGITVVIGWSLGISPKLNEVSATKAERASVEEQNAGFELQLSVLKEQFESIGDLKEDLAQLRRAVPQGADIPVLVGQLDEIAALNGVTLTAITVSDAQPYAPVVAPVPVDAAPIEGAASAGTEPAPTVEAAPVAPATPAAAAPVVNDLITAANFVAVPITLAVDGGYDEVLNFIEGVQKGERLVMVTTFTTSTPAESGNVTATISAFVYVLLNAEDIAVAPTPAA
ncbi:hypothetical protein E3T34_02865 [Cryobacterium sp. TMT1-62]|uniref:type 4a pilus biogenesis protein PilO n=1 Tax=Cryobacterium sp. TMT1-62 TaxID=1259240 RepID=UPI00106AFE01|nr:type 4a pilus biogenesis protein PilO [Cryobacterium sp. TMT1-62]TFD35501.1 hypothetical protein E3T34_02865 [Cryobacterium sp. TMT1-62]